MAKHPIRFVQPCLLLSSFPVRSKPADHSRETTPSMLHRPCRVPGQGSARPVLVLLFSCAVVCSFLYPNPAILRGAAHILNNLVSPWPSVLLCVLCVALWNFITEGTENTEDSETTRRKYYGRCFSRSALPSAMIFSISSGERGRRAVSNL